MTTTKTNSAETVARRTLMLSMAKDGHTCMRGPLAECKHPGWCVGSREYWAAVNKLVREGAVNG